MSTLLNKIIKKRKKKVVMIDGTYIVASLKNPKFTPPPI